MKTSKVVVLHTSPEKTLEDYERLLELADYRSGFSDLREAILKLNLSWSLFFPPVQHLPGRFRVR